MNNTFLIVCSNVRVKERSAVVIGLASSSTIHKWVRANPYYLESVLMHYQ